MYCDVVIPKAGNKLYTYECPDEVTRGMIVSVPFGKGNARGLVVNTKDSIKSDFEPKKIHRVVFSELALREWRLELFDFITERYAAFPAEVAPLFFPPKILERSKIECRFVRNSIIPDCIKGKREEILLFLKERYPGWIKKSTILKNFSTTSHIIEELEKNGLIECRDSLRTSRPRPFQIPFDTLKKRSITNLTGEQQEIYEDVIDKITNRTFQTILLFGITGSGKTAIYYKLFEYILNKEKSGIFLVPEIALTIQTVTYFLEKFKDRVFVYHSGLTDSEKNWIAQKCATSESVVIIGPRSALFLPFRNLSLIVMDEEHDFSYKEEERMPMYHTRDLAEFIGKTLQIPVLLGSGTPDVISISRAIEQKYRLHILSERFRDYENPDIEIVDMKKEESGSVFSITLIREVKKSLENKKGIILFLNRRGYTPIIQCKDCGRIITCPMCSVPLVLHRRERALKCHICGHTEDIPEFCPYCGSFNLNYGGYGTERIEEEIKRFFPEARVAIMDRDSISKKGMKEKIYSDFLSGKIDILIGTQMLSLGLDFPNVETVGVINADIGLGFPDYRAEERVAQTLFQVTGRLRKKGRVIIQTRRPEHPIFIYLKNHDYRAFLLYDLDNRKRYLYPPFTNLIQVIVRSQKRGLARDTIFQIKEELLKDMENFDNILGPAPPPYRKVRGEFRWQLVLKVTDKQLKNAMSILKRIREKFSGRDTKITVNLNPYSML